MKRVLFLTNIPSPYRVDFFNELGKSCDLTVLFEIENSTERDASWENYEFQNFKGVVLNGIRTGYDRALCPGVIRHLKDNQYDEIIISNIASLTGLIASRWLKKHHIDYVYEGDGGIAKSRFGIKAIWKRYVIHGAKMCFSTTKMFDDYCRTYGATDDKIIRYPFSSVCEKDILERPLTEEEKQELKQELGIKEKHYIVSVGRIIHLKGFDILLNVFAKFPSEEWGLYIIGGECNRELAEIMREKQITNVHFVDFVLPEQLRLYYRAADIFAFPTRYDPWGLVVNEAMAQGLPVITTNECGAGTELVRTGENGYLYHCEDYEELGIRLQQFMENKELREKAGAASLRIVHGYTIETMAKAHMDVING